MSASEDPKKTKVDDSCVKEDATIPVNTVTHMLHFKVAGEVGSDTGLPLTQ